MQTLDKEAIITFLIDKIPSIQGIYLFGSYAEGCTSQESDIDIAFLTSFPSLVDG